MALDTILIVAGTTVLLIGLFSRLVKRVFLSSVLLALAAGVVVGPDVLGILDPSEAGDERKLMEEVARLTLAIALMGTGLQITRRDLRENARRCVSLLTGGMLGMWLLTSVGACLLLDLPLWAGFLLGAILTPTDPVVSSALVTGPLAENNLPRRLRRTLQIESGANDGLALPFVLLAAYLATKPAGEAMGDWAVEAGKQVGLAVLVGGVIGFVAARVVELSVHEEEIEEASLLGVGIALAVLTVGLVHTLGGSGILAVFVAALTFSALIEERIREQVGQVQESIAKFFLLPAFLLFGAILPFSLWQELGFAGAGFVAWVLLLRRLPVVPLVLAWAASRRDSVFLGWFGPLGVAAIYYATFAGRFDVPDGERIFAAATLAVTASVVIHSVTATPGARAYAGRSPLATLRRPASAEAETAP